ncbi:hypothetical protein, partial [Mycobacterium sp. UM_11]|uniref:hypothetical protein n=1 Tax=Mycobacterium sp. UM_11 TaxID=1638773 RepID=UPI001E47870D
MCIRDSSSTSSAARCSTVGMDMMLVTLKGNRQDGSQIGPRQFRGTGIGAKSGVMQRFTPRA